MNGKRLLLGMNMFFVLCGTCLADSPNSGSPGGAIQFSGAVVDTSCASQGGNNSTFGYKNCPTRLNGDVLGVQPVGTVRAVGKSNVNIRLLADSRNGRFFDQRYQLVDGLGKPVGSGNYLITMTSP